MKKERTQKIYLVEEETIRLLRKTLEEPPQSPMEESLYCLSLIENLQKLLPEQIIDCRKLSESEKLILSMTAFRDVISWFCVVRIDGSIYEAKLDVAEESQMPVSLILLRSVPYGS